MADQPLVPLHPEAVTDRPDAVRWVVPAGVLAFVGRPADVPEPLASLVAGGVVVDVVVEPAAVVLTLGEGHAWVTDGPRVRTALQRALADPRSWAAPAGADPDDLLRHAVDQVLAGEVGDYVRSHGGRIDVVSAHDGRVAVSLSGTCAHCPAADDTLSSRFETALRSLVPGLRDVEATQEPAAGTRGPTLLPLPRRRS